MNDTVVAMYYSYIACPPNVCVGKIPAGLEPRLHAKAQLLKSNVLQACPDNVYFTCLLTFEVTKSIIPVVQFFFTVRVRAVQTIFALPINEQTYCKRSRHFL